MAHACFLGDGAQANAFDTRCCLGEIFVDHVSVEADRFENLCPAVGCYGGDAHLRHGFNHAIEVGLQEVGSGLFCSEVEVTTINHIANGFESEVWVDRVCAVAKQECKVVHFTWLT